MSEFDSEKSFVQILANGDMLYCGRKLSSVEFDVGNALCDLGKDKTSVETLDGSEGSEYDDCLSEISQDSVESMAIPSRPKAVTKRRRKITSSTELPPGDIRLTYTKQYFDAINSGDGPTIAAMLYKIAIPKVVLVSKKLTHSPDHHLPNYLEIIGVDAIATVIETFSQATPDVVIQMLNQRIHCFANGESCIECDVAMKGSKMYEVTGLQEGSSDKVVLNSVEEVTSGLAKVQLGTTPITPPATAGTVGANKKRLIASITATTTSSSSVVAAAAGEVHPGLSAVSSDHSDNDSTSSTVSREVPVMLGKAHPTRNISVAVKVTFHLNTDKKVFLIVSAKD